jgi:predicted Zn-dependent protease
VTEPGRRWAGAAVVALLLSSLALAALSGCTRGGRRLDPIEIVAPQLDADQERELGYEFDRAVQQQLRVVDDPVVAGFVNDLGRAILAGAGRQPHIYRFRIIDDPSLNAFAVFGGYVYFHSGTLLAAGSVDELAGVMGHEIAHVKLRHHARMEKQTQLPKLLSSLAGIAGTAVTGEPGMLMASQGLNVALELHWSREFEGEADREGLRLVGLAGLRPDAMARFFERIVAAQHRDPERIPPYLFSHPDVEKRIDTVEVMSGRVEIADRPASGLEQGFAEARERLARLQQTGGAPVIAPRPPADAAGVEALREADAAEQRGDLEEALRLLRAAAERWSDDPGLLFRLGEIEARTGRHAAATLSFRRTLALDPTRALVFFRLGESTRELGDAQQAIYAFEQAARRAGAAGNLRARADWEVVKLTFPVIVESGLTGPPPPGAGPLGLPVERFAPGARRLTWWGRLGPRFTAHADDLRARWLAPGDSVGRDTAFEAEQDVVATFLELPAPGAAAGDWTLEIRLGETRVARQRIPVEEAASLQ